MEDQVKYISREKFAEFKAERKDLKENRIPGLAKRIDDARQMGDLSENAEYHAAREEMAWAQSRVKEIDMILDSSVIVDSQSNSDKVGLGSTVTVTTKDKEKKYTIVGAQEADPLSGKISNESPLGSAFIGKKKGDEIKINLPAGLQVFKIKKVE